MTITTYSSTPSPKLLEKIGATNLTLGDAIAEVVANSFDARVDNVNAVIDITVSPEQVMVVDNCAGMEEKVLVEAVRLGVDMGDVITKTATTKGKFGLGMKTACASMGRWWAVYTRPISEDYEYRVVFDLADWERRPDTSEAWKINIEKIQHDVQGPLGELAHGTAIVVKKLRVKNPMVGAVLNKLGESFKPHLDLGEVIRVNGEGAKPYVYNFVPGTEIPIDISFGPSNQLSIKGWVAIDKQTHNNGEYGFNIYRHKQLVQTWYQGWFKAHLMTSRIIGEVQMDFIEATFFKQGLQESEAWRLAHAEMKEFMKPVTAASRELSKQGNINVLVRRRKIVNNLRSSFNLPLDTNEQEKNNVRDGEGQGDGVGSAGESTERVGSGDEILKPVIDSDSVVLEDGLKVAISHIETGLGSNQSLFDYIDDDGDPIPLQTIINTDHVLYAKSKDIDQLRSLAIADSIYRYLVDKCEVNTRKAVGIRDKWLSTGLEDSVGGSE